jgi:hypothetical protein
MEDQAEVAEILRQAAEADQREDREHAATSCPPRWSARQAGWHGCGRRDEAPTPEAVANVTDPDSRLVHTRKGQRPAAASTDARRDRGDLGGRPRRPAVPAPRAGWLHRSGSCCAAPTTLLKLWRHQATRESASPATT